jgi:hypothetical protein
VSAKDIVDLIHGAPGPYLETETSFFGKKRVDPSMKDAKMETDCGGSLITKGALTYGEADALAAAVDLSEFPAFVDAVQPSCYWEPKSDGRVFYGMLYFAIYTFLKLKGHIPEESRRYNNGMEYLYDVVLKRVISARIYTGVGSGFYIRSPALELEK